MSLFLNLAESLSILPFKKPAFNFIDRFCTFSGLISFIYVTPFLLLNVGLVSSSSSSLRDKARLLEGFLFNADIYCYKLFLKLLLLHLTGFGMLCFNLCYIQGGFLIFFLVSSVTHCLFRSMLFDFHLFVKISAFFLLLISSFIPLWLGKVWFQS